jgi:hypothetical protein
LGFEFDVLGLLDQSSTPGELELGDAFLDGGTRDTQEVFAFGFGEAAITLGDVRRDR